MRHWTIWYTYPMMIKQNYPFYRSKFFLKGSEMSKNFRVNEYDIMRRIMRSQGKSQRHVYQIKASKKE